MASLRGLMLHPHPNPLPAGEGITRSLSLPVLTSLLLLRCDLHCEPPPDKIFDKSYPVVILGALDRWIGSTNTFIKRESSRHRATSSRKQRARLWPNHSGGRSQTHRTALPHKAIVFHTGQSPTFRSKQPRAERQKVEQGWP